MESLIHVLLVEDDADDAFLTVRTLERGGYAVASRRVEDADAMQDALHAQPWDVVLSDWSMPRFGGLAALRVLRDSAVDTPFVIVSGTVTEDAAIAAMREGARDYLLKGRLQRLCAVIARELRERDDRRARRQAEQTLVRTEKLRLLGQSTAGIAHDLSNVFAPIPLLISEAEVQAAAGDFAEVRATLADLRRVFDRSMVLLHRIRYISKRTQDVPLQSVEMNQLVEHAIAISRPRASTRRRPMPVIDRQFGVLPVFPGQSAEIVSALVNLLVNAIDALADGGIIRVGTGYNDDSVWVRVTDNGPGMSAEVQRKLAEPFFTTKGEQGTGLGVAMVRGCVDLHGGSMVIESAEGFGTSVTLWFPRAASGAGDGRA